MAPFIFLTVSHVTFHLLMPIISNVENIPAYSYR